MNKTEILEKIAECSKEDFDGHTEFQRLSPKERLQWLSNTAYFVYKAAEKNPFLNCNKYFKVISKNQPFHLTTNKKC